MGVVIVYTVKKLPPFVAQEPRAHQLSDCFFMPKSTSLRNRMLRAVREFTDMIQRYPSTDPDMRMMQDLAPMLTWYALRIRQIPDPEFVVSRIVDALWYVIHNFDGNRGAKPSTLLMIMLRYVFRDPRYLSDQHLIRIPAHILSAIRRLERLRRCGKEPDKTFAAANGGWPVVRRAAHAAALNPVLSLDSSSPYPVRRRATSVLMDHNQPEPLQFLAGAEQHRALYTALERLAPRSAYILRELVGLQGAPRTLRDIGQDLGLSGERVRQIKTAALSQLRRLLHCSTSILEADSFYRITLRDRAPVTAASEDGEDVDPPLETAAAPRHDQPPSRRYASHQEPAAMPSDHRFDSPLRPLHFDPPWCEYHDAVFEPPPAVSEAAPAPLHA